MTKTKIKAIEVYNNPSKGKYVDALYRKVEVHNYDYLISDGYSIIKLRENPGFEEYTGQVIGNLYRDFKDNFNLIKLCINYDELNTYLLEHCYKTCNLKLYKRIIKIMGKDTCVGVHENVNHSIIIMFTNLKGEEAYLLPEVIK